MKTSMNIEAELSFMKKMFLFEENPFRNCCNMKKKRFELSSEDLRTIISIGKQPLFTCYALIGLFVCNAYVRFMLILHYQTCAYIIELTIILIWGKFKNI